MVVRVPAQRAQGAGSLCLVAPPASGSSHGQAAFPVERQDGAIGTRYVPDSSLSAGKAEPLPGICHGSPRSRSDWLDFGHVVLPALEDGRNLRAWTRGDGGAAADP